MILNNLANYLSEGTDLKVPVERSKRCHHSKQSHLRNWILNWHILRGTLAQAIVVKILGCCSGRLP